MESTTIKDSLLEVVKGSDFGRVPARFPVVFCGGHGVQGLDTYRIIRDKFYPVSFACLSLSWDEESAESVACVRL